MIVWEVYDANEPHNTRRRYYTVLKNAVAFLLKVSRDDTSEHLEEGIPTKWEVPCVRAWAADYEGEQYVAFFTNGGLIQSVLNTPHVGNTILYMRKATEQAVARRHIVFNDKEKDV